MEGDEINTRSLGNEPPAISVRVDRVPPPEPAKISPLQPPEAFTIVVPPQPPLNSTPWAFLHIHTCVQHTMAFLPSLSFPFGPSRCRGTSRETSTTPSSFDQSNFPPLSLSRQIRCQIYSICITDEASIRHVLTTRIPSYIFNPKIAKPSVTEFRVFEGSFNPSGPPALL